MTSSDEFQIERHVYAVCIVANRAEDVVEESDDDFRERILRNELPVLFNPTAVQAFQDMFLAEVYSEESAARWFAARLAPPPPEPEFDGWITVYPKVPS